jgi:putative phosphoribosyl transferase
MRGTWDAGTAERWRVRFTDRREAGRRLAERLLLGGYEQPVVVGLPRGGIPVAYEVATALGAPLDVLVVRKLGCPWQPELGVGAIAEDGVTLLDHALIHRVGVSAAELETVLRDETIELERRVARYRGRRPSLDLAGRTVLLVDDGLATGSTARAAIEVVRERGARHVVLAVPVAPPDTVAALEQVADEVVCLRTPERFAAVGASYRDFSQTTDEEVRRLLRATDDPEPEQVDRRSRTRLARREVRIPVPGGLVLPGELAGPVHPFGTVIFAHGSGSSRFSPRNVEVARVLHRAGLGTLLFDLLTLDEASDRSKVFDVQLLASRLVAATRWIREDQATAGDAGATIGYFGASTGAAAALWAAADLGQEVGAVVSRGGRPDLAAPRLIDVTAHTLLIVGGRDLAVIELNRMAHHALAGPSRLEIVPGATHLFEEPGALLRVAELSRRWFVHHLAAAPPRAARPAAQPAGRR